jgi:glycosyltransferase involved in cell wall biosynthesis
VRIRAGVRRPRSALFPAKTGAGPVVLHATQPTTAGVAQFVLSIAAVQREHGWQVVVASPPDEAFVARLRAIGVDHRAWDASRNPGPGTAREVRALRSIARAVRPDVLHLHSSKAGLAGRLGAGGVAPVVFQPHAWSFEAVDGPMRVATTGWERFAARRTEVVLCVSEAERERGRAAGIRARFEVVANGVDIAEFGFVDRDSGRLARDRLALGTAPVVVCVGRICRQKGQDLLVRAWSHVVDAIPDARLVFVGDGPDRADLESSAPPTITFAGQRDDVADWLAAADVVAMPSRWEGMAFTALEAMAVGRSVVAFDVDGVHESLGDTGALVAADDIAGFAAAIVARLDDDELRAREGRAARVRVERNHDARNQLARVVQLTADISGRGSVGGAERADRG